MTTAGMPPIVAVTSAAGSATAAVSFNTFDPDAFTIEGMPTTAPFHRALVEDPDFIESRIHTRWVESTFLERFA